MTLWLLLVLAFLVQEPVSTTGLLSEVYAHHYSLLIVHGLFLVATVTDIVVGYYLGAFIYKRFAHTKFISRAKEKFDNLLRIFGKKGKVVTLIFFVPVLFPATAIFLSWLDVSIVEALIYVLIGEIIFWYVPEWLIVFGVHTFTNNSHIALFVILGISLVGSIFAKRAYNKVVKSKQ